MKHPFLILIYCLIALVSCQETNYSILKTSLKDIPNNHRSVELFPITEIYNPSDIYSIGDYIVVVNNNKKCNILYLYNRERMSFSRAFGLYGRAGNEYLFIDRSPKPNNDSTLFLYTDYINCSEFRINRDTIKEINKYRITNDISNNVIILNDSLVFNRTLQADHAFSIYNYRLRENQVSFGDFPDCPIKPKTDADRDNVCASSSVYNSDQRLLVTFYESLPLIRIFDMNAYKCLQEVELIDVHKQISSLDEYYDDKNVIYFSRPIATRDRIYVSLIDNQADLVPEQTSLLAMDWSGNITDKYTINKFCPIYTVSETGVFYGITFCDNNIMLCKIKL
ncbi:MAG: hypothetical protein HPZ78_11585 [Barnesiella sp.]|jgi:lipoprotein|nr:hypothetical protein [Barnesiella sp.]